MEYDLRVNRRAVGGGDGVGSEDDSIGGANREQLCRRSLRDHHLWREERRMGNCLCQGYRVSRRSKACVRRRDEVEARHVVHRRSRLGGRRLGGVVSNDRTLNRRRWRRGLILVSGDQVDRRVVVPAERSLKQVCETRREAIEAEVERS